jgi:hypothetical protein
LDQRCPERWKDAKAYFTRNHEVESMNFTNLLAARNSIFTSASHFGEELSGRLKVGARRQHAIPGSSLGVVQAARISRFTSKT